MKVLSINLGLGEEQLQNAFGGENIGACLRVNFYPKCPQPDLTLGLSSHSDPGGMTLLLPDSNVPGLQVRKDGNWITVKPVPHAFIVNIGDQIQVTYTFSVSLTRLSIYIYIYICLDEIYETYREHGGVIFLMG
jgi:isopenicillin N synthase-like dioxygenase